MSGDEEERALKKGKKFITCDDDERTEKHQKWNDDTHVFFKKIQETVVAKQELEDAEFDAGHEKDGDGDSPAKIKVRQARKKLGELREELKIAHDLACSSHVKFMEYSSVPFMEAVNALGMDDISLPTTTPMKKPPAVVIVYDGQEYGLDNCPKIALQYFIYMMKKGSAPLKIDPNNPGVLATPAWIFEDWTELDAARAIIVLRTRGVKPEKWYPFDKTHKNRNYPAVPNGDLNKKDYPQDTWKNRLAFVLYPELFDVRKEGRDNKLFYLLDE